MAEIVHEMAPGAQLYLICINTEVDFAAAVAYAKAQGASVISHSASWFGPCAVTVRGVRRVAADRPRRRHPLGQLRRQLRARPTGRARSTALTETGGTTGRRMTRATRSSGRTTPSLRLPPLGRVAGGASDFDLVLVDSATGQEVAARTTPGSGRPQSEGVCAASAPGANLTARGASTATREVDAQMEHVRLRHPPLQYQTAAGSLLDPATSPATLAVGALCWQSRQPESTARRARRSTAV